MTCAVRFCASKVQPRSLPNCAVCFSTGRSHELTSRVAAMEAFDLAAAALPKPPNFCLVNISVDCSDMVECFPVVWGALERVHSQQTAEGSKSPVTESSSESPPSPPPTKAPKTHVMLGAAVRDQRFNGKAFCEVMLGHVPDLAMTAFTLDRIPQALDPSLPPPFLGIAQIDWRLATQHLKDINLCMDKVATMVGAPLVGGVLPPAERKSDSEATSTMPATAGSIGAADAMFCINDNVYRGSAAVAVLHSAFLTADVITAWPANDPTVDNSAPWRATDITLDEASCSLTIAKINNQPATDVIREVYEGPRLKERLTSRLFLAFQLDSEGSWLPFGFRGLVDVQCINVPLPPAVFLALRDRMSRDGEATAGGPSLPFRFVCDDKDVDTPAVAESLIAYEQQLLRLDTTAHRAAPLVSETQRVVVHQEQVREVVAANAALVHWFHPGLYETMSVSPSMAGDAAFVLDPVDSRGPQHVPSIASRCLGHVLPIAGICVPGQVTPFSLPALTQPAPPVAVCAVASRSAVHVFLREKSTNADAGATKSAD